LAELLDELAGVWANEALRLLAHEMAVRLYDRPWLTAKPRVIVGNAK